MERGDTKRIAVIGCGRSGTKFISERLNLGHERYNENGIADWSLTTDGYFSKPEDDLIYLHQVRHPLKTISSCQTIDDERVWAFIAKYIDLKNDELVLRCMKYWYYWNLLAEAKAVYTYRVEQLGFSTANTRLHTDLTWNDLYKTDEDLTNKIITLSLRYGY